MTCTLEFTGYTARLIDDRKLAVITRGTVSPIKELNVHSSRTQGGTEQAIFCLFTDPAIGLFMYLFFDRAMYYLFVRRVKVKVK